MGAGHTQHVDFDSFSYVTQNVSVSAYSLPPYAILRITTRVHAVGFNISSSVSEQRELSRV